jgi:hypothetical protein
MRRNWIVCLLLVVLASACATATEEVTTTTVAVTTTIATTSTAAETTTTARPTTTLAPDAAPPELAGSWNTEIAGVPVTLRLNSTSYSIRRGDAMGSGSISVTGDQIAFSRSDLCEGTGVYSWTVEANTLTFVQEDPPDPCTGRSSVLIDIAYSR